MSSTVVGSPWQEVLGHRVELSEPPAATVGGPGIWDSALWDSEEWGAGWAPTFHDVTANLLDAHATLGATGLDVSAGIGVIELDLLDLGGAYSPGGSVDWLLGRHVRGWLTPAGMGERPGFYGIIDKAEAGGSFAVPTVQVTAYDVRALIAPVVTATPVADAPQRADERLVAILDAAGFPPELVLVEEDTTPLLADDTLDLGDLLDRTAESSAGLVWGDSSGRIRTRNRGWINGSPESDPNAMLYVYAGTPPPPPALSRRPDAATSPHANYPGNGPPQAIDGNLSTLWQPVNGLTVAELRTSRAAGSAELVTAIRHRYAGGTNYPAAYEIRASIDGSSWVTVAARTGNTAIDLTDPIPEPYQRCDHYAMRATSWYADGPTYAYLAMSEVEYLTVPDIAVAQTTDLASSESLGTVRNHVTYSNRAEPPVAVVALDLASSRRYGWRKATVTDLACDEALLVELAARDIALHATPFRVCEGATVTVYDEATAAAAAVELGDVVTVGRNDPGVDEWELAGIVTGIELTFDASRFTVALTVVDTGAIVLGGPGRWDSATWAGNRWTDDELVLRAGELAPTDTDPAAAAV